MGYKVIWSDCALFYELEKNTFLSLLGLFENFLMRAFGIFSASSRLWMIGLARSSCAWTDGLFIRKGHFSFKQTLIKRWKKVFFDCNGFVLRRRFCPLYSEKLGTTVWSWRQDSARRTVVVSKGFIGVAACELFGIVTGRWHWWKFHTPVGTTSNDAK